MDFCLMPWRLLQFNLIQNFILSTCWSCGYKIKSTAMPICDSFCNFSFVKDCIRLMRLQTGFQRIKHAFILKQTIIIFQADDNNFQPVDNNFQSENYWFIRIKRMLQNPDSIVAWLKEIWLYSKTYRGSPVIRHHSKM